MKHLNELLIIFLLTCFCFSCGSKPEETNTEPVLTPAMDTSETPAPVEDTLNNRPNSIASSVSAPFLYGIDISKYQGDEVAQLDFKTDSLTFIICKATEGLSSTDSNFVSNWSGIKAGGYIRGAYHFYHANDDPTEQVTHYASTIGDLSANDLPPIVDFEESSTDARKTVAETQEDLLTFLQTLQSKLDRTPIIYTDIQTGNKFLNNSSFAEYPLWVANYTTRETPHLPAAWQDKGWTFWQKSSDYKIGTVTNDFDQFNGNKAEFLNFIATH